MSPDEIWDEDVPVGEQIDETLRRQEAALTERGRMTPQNPEVRGLPRSVSASEFLRDLMAAAEVPNHGEETWEKKMAWDRYNEAYFKLERLMRPDAALPLIVDVVEAAENDSDMGDADDATVAALTALREHLEEGDE